MRLGFTGTREGMTAAQTATLQNLMRGESGEFHHGDCVGADEEAATIAKSAGLTIIVHPPTDARMRAYSQFGELRPAKPFLARNKAIVDECDTLIAAPKEVAEQQRSGTWSTVRYARKLGRRIWVIRPDGRAMADA